MVMFWVALLAISILIYLLLDGFDLGVGMLFGLADGEARRDEMLRTIAPVWDGNETWLVVTGVIMWGAFPVVYAMLMPAFYIPVVVMLLGLILRGVAFEFRGKASRSRRVWDVSFTVGSFAASFMQGAMVGALVEGLQFSNGEYVGGTFGWLTGFSVLCGIGLCFGYALLGACWLVGKCEGPIRDATRRQIPLLAVAVLAFLVVVFTHALVEHLPILRRWIERPYLFVFPLIGAGAAAVLATSILRHDDYWPFHMVALIFASAFGTLALSFWPYMIPFVITIEEAAAPHASLAFMFWGAGLFVFPLMLLYVAVGYRVFRGKTAATADHY
ncbi:cytochrome d ubiquinol oxidase subunit II [Bradyrhizobium diazoefficiens]|jgi:cytochrome bd ubiquinol oxidase subunit II|uniref:Putative Cytochrome d ubiquinol oxidase, subunit II n=1 Tax=Bradyrhizobium diazoefficiens SEMIA 5080 TaxID=754504 RepID=A0A837C627_9BRAD|nr:MULTISPECIES: cytochrome d ubiquinol oxidase subunit II [Bradyrhizobium]APO48842.1 quinol oxidase subunit 2 [Bradyrhizobium diazoefficiens]KGJ64700.1 putative Cytochrome d ubiquinol oxidase, subunit II [Bradyrhizobium diazoefficiens SEMIA 5080]KOY09630.1 quinol oxidase subunit 2 [Bradyrhizobium diazoefficiens]MCD9293381.1 cytochrome d ubiquinol oxidase subunit II [Bradyrhizobium diazoefficiens]MCD9813186.1 cytochrome d ubiquinol oxidase subunit II [Bradyrhizobium diazoefficiens]